MEFNKHDRTGPLPGGAEALLFGRALRSNLGRLPGPYKLTLALTWRCNSRCRLCRIWEREPEEGGGLSPEEIARLLDSSPNLSWLDLTGGEPTCREDLAEVLGLVARRLPRLALLHMPTNGLLPERAEAAVRAALSAGARRFYVSVSIDGPPETNDRLRGVPGAFERSVETLSRLRSLAAGPTGRGLKIFAGMTVSGENFEEVEELEGILPERLPGFGPGDLHLNLVHYSSHYYCNEHLRRPFTVRERRAIEDLLKTRHGGGLARSLHPAALLETGYRAFLPRYLSGETHPLPCQALSASAFVDPSGNVYPCIGYDRPVGNVREAGENLEGLWSGQEAHAARADLASGQCPGCWTPCEAYQSLLGSLLKPWRAAAGAWF